MDESIGKRLKRLRLAHGLSQRDLSSPGVSYAYISRIEAGARTPSVKALRKLAPKLGVSVQYLEEGEEGSLEAGLHVAGVKLEDLNAEELAFVQQVSDAYARMGAHEAALKVLDDRETYRLQMLELEAEVIRQRRAAGGKEV